MTTGEAQEPARGGWWSRLLPAAQRKPLGELADQLDLAGRDRASKRSAFWSMLVISAVIASAGVLADSTATVIGAMIIAPLSRPIMGMALGIVTADRRLLLRSAGVVALGLFVVVGVGVIASLAVPGGENLLANTQVSGRTSPRLADLVAAVATGLAGAVGLSRRDVSDVLPGVAIAISLVPPLAVAGICLGQGEFALAAGASVLFASNVLSLVLAGTAVFAGYGYAWKAARVTRAYATIALMMVLVLVPLGANTAANLLVNAWTNRITAAATRWVGAVPGAEVRGVTIAAHTATIDILAPQQLPPVGNLLNALHGQVPTGVRIVLNVSNGQRIDAGTVR
ncbi:TIGR00341 family protein [Dactylosporangium sucinum]|uniref:Membrane protein n=1 Tax=Dactylosporangium sucinum TaxID=1424081 RepID=A0A917UA82_9ACTN|nr:TIGR00341 family protein [Dactylosporangium sucinum]GGM71123.1 membrane protein [Dactylosporangium sucinum]